MRKRDTRARQAAATVAMAACGAVAAAGCSAAAQSSAAQSSATQSSAAQPSATQPSAAQSPAAAGSGGAVAPLTGQAATAVAARRPAVAVAVTSDHPVGLGHADLVLEEMAVPVRFLAVFQSQQSARVGPVAATRPVDGQALSVLHPVTGYAGGTSSFISVLDATRVIDAGYAGHPAAYTQGATGLTVVPAALAAVGSAGPPPELLPYRTAGTLLASTGESHPRSVRIASLGRPPQRWTFDARTGRWVETAGGPRVSVANLIVQIVPFKLVYLSRKYHETTQSARVIGTGRIIAFSGAAPGGTAGTGGTAATMAAGYWDKPSLGALTDYFDLAHLPMSFGPGPTWVILAPSDTSVSASPAGAGQS